MTRPGQARALEIVVIIAFVSLGPACRIDRSADGQNVARLDSPSRMLDNKLWTTNNLIVDTRLSYCYEDSTVNCARYGRLYTWEGAREGCQSLGDGFRLPTDDEWRQMTKHYGGVMSDSADSGKAAYEALLIGGSSGFKALLGGNRSENRKYERLEDHGFYWTASETSPSTAWFYNFGRGGLSLNRHREGDKRMAVSVRCVRD